MRLRCVLLSAGVLVAESRVPTMLVPPQGQVLILHLEGKGKQIYSCQSARGVYAWKLKAPDAKLFRPNGELAGRHFAGPAWEASDGSRITGKLVASAPSPASNSIPWLLLSVTSHDGSGILSRVQSIQRLETKGGIAPATGCSVSNENKETPVPYEAAYYFYGMPQP
jgi:Protein of unknown function (DUF3455)